MKKFISLSMAAVFAAGFAVAQDEVVIIEQVPAQAEVEVTVENALVSAYVWRGQVYNNDFALQPQMSLSVNDISFNIWGNYDLVNNNNDSNGEFSEIDLSIAYTLPIDINQMSFDVGLINYNFPGNGDNSTPSTTELFASATVLSWQKYIIPSVTFFGDIDEVNGTYLLFDIVAPFQVSDALSLEIGASAGWGNTSYNDYYWGGKKDSGFNDYNFYGVASYEITESITASVNMTYTMLEGGSIRKASTKDNLYENDDKFWMGFNMAYDF